MLVSISTRNRLPPTHGNWPLIGTNAFSLFVGEKIEKLFLLGGLEPKVFGPLAPCLTPMEGGQRG